MRQRLLFRDSRHPLARRIAPAAFASGIDGADVDPDFLAAGEASEFEAALFAGVGELPVRVWAEGVTRGVLDLVVVDDAGLAVAVAGDLAVVIAHGEFEAGGLIWDGLWRRGAFHTHEGGIHLGLGVGCLADIGGEVDGSFDDG